MAPYCLESVFVGHKRAAVDRHGGTIQESWWRVIAKPSGPIRTGDFTYLIVQWEDKQEIKCSGKLGSPVFMEEGFAHFTGIFSSLAGSAQPVKVLVPLIWVDLTTWEHLRLLFTLWLYKLPVVSPIPFPATPLSMTPPEHRLNQSTQSYVRRMFLPVDDLAQVASESVGLEDASHLV
ncbi:hypothetical protein D9613_003369 [Agrocybe pediades]|uniref:Uncharacterized protein n=1 Tax=Agrocybe pediades TaxID=84607 RepID=A0A8H4QR37_9AGAR|nr:hypothetical protein D9613_003369 [Agrocybe pediades]